MNETQQEYVEAVRRGEKSIVKVCEELGELDSNAYRNHGYREMLFAIDSLNRSGDSEWRRVFLQGVMNNAEWTDGGRLSADAYSEIAEYQAEYGYGEFGMGLVIDMYEAIEKKPVNADSFTRRTIREFFNGVQPVTDHVLFMIKRFFATRKILSNEDIELLFHIREETKGLENTSGFDHFFVSSIMDWLMDSDVMAKGVNKTKVLRHLEVSDEMTDAEQKLIRAMKDKGITMPDELLGHIDLSKDRLMGMA